MASFLDYNLPEYEKLVSCPYNKAHQVVKHRLPNHLIKCRRSHSSAGTKECCFDSSHVYPIEEIKLHEATCPGRLTVELFMAAETNRKSSASKADSGKASMSSIASFNVAQDNDDEDDWDDIPPVATYNPMKKVLESNIIRNIQHKTPSQRKQEREHENARLLEIRQKLGERSK